MTPSPGDGLNQFHEPVIPVKVAHDGHLRCIQPAAGLHEIAELALPDKPGDKRKFLPQNVTVMFPSDCRLHSQGRNRSRF